MHIMVAFTLWISWKHALLTSRQDSILSRWVTGICAQPQGVGRISCIVMNGGGDMFADFKGWMLTCSHYQLMQTLFKIRLINGYITMDSIWTQNWMLESWLLSRDCVLWLLSLVQKSDVPFWSAPVNIWLWFLTAWTSAQNAKQSHW